MKTYEDISKNRLPIMGVAALFIMLFHGTMIIPIKPISILVKIGYLGVDIFMFMSGFSMHNSFDKCRNNNIFFKKRLLRIMPTFLPFAVFWVCSHLIFDYGSIESIKNAMHTKDFWVNMIIFRWFIPAICFCYFITPLIDYAFEKSGYTLKSLVIYVGMTLLIAVPFVYLRSSVALMVLLRVPEYIIGYYYAKALPKSKVYLRIVVLLFLYCVYYVLIDHYSDTFLADTGLYWWPAILCVSSMVVCLSKCKIDYRILKFMGKYSLELYLWHVWIMYRFESLLLKYHIQLDKYGIISNCLSIIFACIVAWVYAWLIRKMIQPLMGTMSGSWDSTN